jgi:hypothetical protein
MTKESAYRIPIRIIRLEDMGHGVGTWKTGELSGVSARHIASILSIPVVSSEYLDDKVSREFIFEVGSHESFAGFLMHIWDWKGSSFEGRWSTFGPHSYFEVMFGKDYKAIDKTAQFTARDSILA